MIEQALEDIEKQAKQAKKIQDNLYSSAKKLLESDDINPELKAMLKGVLENGLEGMSIDQFVTNAKKLNDASKPGS